MLMTRPEKLILENQVRIMQALSIFLVPEDRRKPHWPNHHASVLGGAIETTLDALGNAQISPQEPR
jgi:hypothetical protein